VVVIPKSVTPARISANLAAAHGLRLSDDDMTALLNLDRGLRYCKFSSNAAAPEFPFHLNERVAAQPTVRLSSGASMPALALGTWQAPPGEVRAAVLSALRQETKQSKVDPIRQFSLLVASLAASATGSDDIRAGTTIPCARAVLRLLVNCLDHLRPSSKFIEADPVSSIAAQIAQTLGIDPAATEAIDLALVLLADHQLTPQTVAVRLTASSGASLYHCLNSALSVQSSSRSRRSCDRVEDLLLNSSDGEQFCRMLERQRGSAGNSAGLDHPLYPNGDPRAQLLLATAQRYLQRGNCSNRFADHITQLQSRTGMRPGVEIGLVMLCHALEMPERSAAALLTISRCAGWIGHVIEQRTAGLMLRPRNRYRG
jgi:citrate synthase